MFMFFHDLSNLRKVARNTIKCLFYMDSLKAKALAKELNELACKGCTEGWLERHDGLSDPIQDIIACGLHGFITSDRQERLVNEVKEIITEK